MPAVMTPVGPVDLSVVLFRNRTVFIGEHIDEMVAQRVISQLVTLAAIDEEADIWVCTFLFLIILSLGFLLFVFYILKL